MEKVKPFKRIRNKIAYGAFKIGKRKAIAKLDEVKNEELRRAGKLALDVADDVVYLLTDEVPENRTQLEDYLKESENRTRLTDLGLTSLRGVAIEKLEGEKLDDVISLIELLGSALSEELEAPATA